MATGEDKIIKMSKKQFRKIVEQNITQKALKYLEEGQGKMKSYIKQDSFKLADYLSPLNSKLHKEEKRFMFLIRNNALNLSGEYNSPVGRRVPPAPPPHLECKLGYIEKENIEHIYNNISMRINK